MHFLLFFREMTINMESNYLYICTDLSVIPFTVVVNVIVPCSRTISLLTLFFVYESMFWSYCVLMTSD